MLFVFLFFMITRWMGWSPQRCVCVRACVRVGVSEFLSESRSAVFCRDRLSAWKQKDPLCLQPRARLLVHTLNLISRFPPQPWAEGNKTRRQEVFHWNAGAGPQIIPFQLGWFHCFCWCITSYRDGHLVPWPASHGNCVKWLLNRQRVSFCSQKPPPR